MGTLVGTSSTGAGRNEQRVNDKGEALTFSTIITQLEEASSDGDAYNWSSGIINIDAGDTVLLIKNESDLILDIESITINNGSTASQYQIHLPTTEVTPTGTTITGTNLNTGDSSVANTTSKSDETNNTQGVVLFTPMMSADSNKTINTIGLRIAKNKSIAVDVVELTSEAGVTIRGHY